MEDPVETLRHEHEAIEHLLAALDGMAAHLDKGGGYPETDLAKAMTVVSEFADGCHHAKEESVLFPRLVAASPERGADLARRLTSDHKAFRKLVTDTRSLMPKAGGDRAARRQVAKNLGTYTRLLREHIRVENEELLPEVDRAISARERAHVADEFERVEREEIGAGVHEKYHADIHALAERYA